MFIYWHIPTYEAFEKFQNLSILTTQAMSRKGNYYDNAPMENFFSVLRREIYDGHIYRSRQELVRSIERFIHYYNNDRIKEKLGGLSPKQYRERMNAA